MALGLPPRTVSRLPGPDMIERRLEFADELRRYVGYLDSISAIAAVRDAGLLS